MRFKLSLTKLTFDHLKQYHNNGKIPKGKGKVSFRNLKPPCQVHERLETNFYLGFVLKKAGLTAESQSCVCVVSVVGVYCVCVVYVLRVCVCVLWVGACCVQTHMNVCSNYPKT